METYYSFPNIDRFNNCFSYSAGANTPWFDIIIPEGSYHVEDIDEFIQREMRKNDHYDKVNDKNNIEISANTNTLKSEIFHKNNYAVDNFCATEYQHFHACKPADTLNQIRSANPTSGPVVSQGSAPSGTIANPHDRS